MMHAMRELQCFLAKHELSRRCVCVCDKAVLQCVRMLSLSANLMCTLQPFPRRHPCLLLGNGWLAFSRLVVAWMVESLELDWQPLGLVFIKLVGAPWSGRPPRREQARGCCCRGTRSCCRPTCSGGALHTSPSHCKRDMA